MKSARQQRRTRTPGSVQETFIKAHRVFEQVVCLREDGGEYAFANVIEASGLSYDLKSGQEQRQLNELNQRFLASLDFDLQVLWLVQPLHTDPYLAQFALSMPAREPTDLFVTTAAEEALSPTITASLPEPLTTTKAAEEAFLRAIARLLAGHPVESAEEAIDPTTVLSHAHTEAIKQLHAQRPLLARSLYLVYRVLPDEEEAPAASSRMSLLAPFSAPRRARRRKRSFAEALADCRQILDVRAEHLLTLLGSMGLSGRRLSGSDLITFYERCLTPTTSIPDPLPAQVLEGIGRPVALADPPAVTRSLPRRTSVPYSAPPQMPTGRDLVGVDLASLSDLLAPDGIEVRSDAVCVGDEWVRVLVVQHLPRVVTAGWLRPLTHLQEPLQVSFHLHPIETVSILPRLQRRQTEHASSVLLASRKGASVDPQVKVAATDLERLIGQLASGEERMLSVSMQILVRAESREALEARCARVQATLRAMLLRVRLARFEQDLALLSCLPYAHNRLERGILLSSQAASSLFLFVSHGQFHQTGVLEGITPQGDPVALDPFSREMSNANRLILAPPGWGKSHSIKTLISRLVLKSQCVARHIAAEEGEVALPGYQVIVIDPETEYGPLGWAHQGQTIRLAPGSSQHLNPFDLPNRPAGQQERGDALADQVSYLHALFDIMLADRQPGGRMGRLLPQEKGLLDRAFFETYRRVGITRDRETHQRQAPLVRDLYDVLRSGVCGRDRTGLRERLARYVTGSLAGLFASPTNVSLDRPLIIFDLHDLETELRPVGLFLVSNFVWSTTFQSRIPRLLVVDEAAHVMHFESGATFLEDLVRRARKHYLGVILISQHPEIFRTSAIPANCETHVLLHQDSSALPLLTEMFHLSEREQHVLRTLPVGEGLVLTSTKRLQVRFVANRCEQALASTSPQQRAAWQEEILLRAEQDATKEAVETEPPAPSSALTDFFLEDSEEEEEGIPWDWEQEDDEEDQEEKGRDWLGEEDEEGEWFAEDEEKDMARYEKVQEEVGKNGEEEDNAHHNHAHTEEDVAVFTAREEPEKAQVAAKTFPDEEQPTTPPAVMAGRKANVRKPQRAGWNPSEQKGGEGETPS